MTSSESQPRTRARKRRVNRLHALRSKWGDCYWKPGDEMADRCVELEPDLIEFENDIRADFVKYVRAAQPAPDPEAIRLLRELTAFCELGTRDARGYCRWCGYNQPKAKQPHALSCAVGQARSFLSKSEARESGGEL